MKCKKIQELLKTNYLDNELKPEETRSIKEHLKECRQCRELEEALRHQHMLFQKNKREEVPGHIWGNISNAIIRENLKETRGPAILEHLRELIWGKKPVFVLATTFAVVIFCVVFAGVLLRQARLSPKGEDILASYTLSDESGELIYGFGTNIEEYFL